MFTAKLFLGLPVNRELAAHLAKINPKILALFIQNQEIYLKEIIIKKQRFLGKSIESVIDLPSLELLEINIYSLLKRLLPEYPFEKIPLRLFPLQDAE